MASQASTWFLSHPRIMKRRGFLATPAVALAAPATAPILPVVASGDGVPLSPVAYAELLQKLSGGIAADNYGLGGVVEKLEAYMAAELGKEMAVWFPTGTLANHMAVRMLAGDRKRVLVQAESHLYNDCGDCCQTLSDLNLIPLAPGRATFTLDEVKDMANRSATGRVKTPIGAIMIESPVRRKTGEAFDIEQMKKISGFARSEGIGLHLDGARLYMAAAYSGLPVHDYASLFDTVYVSMYKYFGAASGAILAGPKKLLTDLFHARRMFGGGQHEAWPFAGIAMNGVQGFSARYSKAVQTGEAVIEGLKADSRFQVQRIPNGTNLFLLKVRDSISFQRKAQAAGIVLSAPKDDQFIVAVNETWLRATAPEILARLRS